MGELDDGQHRRITSTALTAQPISDHGFAGNASLSSTESNCLGLLRPIILIPNKIASSTEGGDDRFEREQDELEYDSFGIFGDRDDVTAFPVNGRPSCSFPRLHVSHWRWCLWVVRKLP
jgi:hypothetical protein